MINVRAGEIEKTYFRSDRFFISEGDWFFATRECEIKGPFSSRMDAEIELLGYIVTVSDFKEKKSS